MPWPAIGLEPRDPWAWDGARRPTPPVPPLPPPRPGGTDFVATTLPSGSTLVDPLSWTLIPVVNLGATDTGVTLDNGTLRFDAGGLVSFRTEGMFGFSQGLQTLALGYVLNAALPLEYARLPAPGRASVTWQLQLAAGDRLGLRVSSDSAFQPIEWSQVTLSGILVP